MLPEAVARQLIADHGGRPRGVGELVGAPHAALENPGCGDYVTVWVRVEGGRLAEVRFTGKGCAVSQASASLMTQRLGGQALEEVHALSASYRAMVMGEAAPDPVLGDLVALAGMSRLHARRKCALLAWNALETVLGEVGEGMTTPSPAEVALAGEEAVNARDEARLLALSDPDIEIVGPRGSVQGHAVLADWLNRAGLSFETGRRFGLGAEIVHEQVGQWHDLETGAVKSESPIASHYRVEGGRVVYVARYDELSTALERAGLEEGQGVG